MIEECSLAQIPQGEEVEKAWAVRKLVLTINREVSKDWWMWKLGYRELKHEQKASKPLLWKRKREGRWQFEWEMGSKTTLRMVDT